MGTVQIRSVFTPALAELEEWELLDSESQGVSGRSEAQLNCWRYVHLKRAIDLVGAVSLFAGLALPGLMCAAAVAFTSRGPIFYRETRIGRHGRPFRIWKFRTMRHVAECPTGNTEDLCSSEELLRWRTQKDLPDPRVTRSGSFLRRWSLDEIPQILNVLRGEMSLIGPRPVVEEEMELYGDLRDYYLAARPGLSGLWQVSGRSDVNFATRAWLDAHYVSNWSLRKDVHILIRTVPAVFKRVGAR